VLVFLWNWRSTVIAAIAIPTSIIATFGLIWFQGFTLNSMTMLALTLAVGIVIDDAIVVLENIYRFVEEKGARRSRRRRGDARDRPRRAGHDAVAGRDLRSRSVSWAASSAGS
jgi:Cu/Ag efflux pump CusA